MSQSTILIVEDDEGLAALECAILEGEGFTVEEARTGYEALRLLADRDYALIVLDYRLPDMTGIDILSALGERAHSLPVVVVTGYSDPQLKKDLMLAGADDFIVKSGFSFLDEIPRAVRDILARCSVLWLLCVWGPVVQAW